MKGKKNCRASGGSVEPMVVSGNPKVIKEAKERKKGGRVHADEAQDKKLIKKMLGKPDGEKAKHRADRPHRKSGGAVNATKSPFSSARSVTSPPKSAD